jgi:hypothetical protein
LEIFDTWCEDITVKSFSASDADPAALIACFLLSSALAGNPDPFTPVWFFQGNPK